VDWWPAVELNEEQERLLSTMLSDQLKSERSSDLSCVVADSDKVAYFKLMRLPGQPSLPPLLVRLFSLIAASVLQKSSKTYVAVSTTAHSHTSLAVYHMVVDNCLYQDV